MYREDSLVLISLLFFQTLLGKGRFDTYADGTEL